MKRLFKYLPLALLALTFVACGNNLVSRADYDAAVSRVDELKARNDSLELELSDLKMYVDFLTEENTQLVNELNNNPCDLQ